MLCWGERVVHLVYADAHVVAGVHLGVAEGECEGVGVEDLCCGAEV